MLGAERSGTSAVAEMVHRWGAYAGDPDDLPEPDHRNERPRWEYQPLWHNRVRDTGAGASALSDAQTRLSQLLAMTQRPDTPLHADFPL
ncbi:MAG TPA: hypothetical protein VGO19_09315, partial [Actinomycetes bacterium]